MVKKTEERKVKDIKNPNVESPFSWPEAYSDYIKFLEVFNKTQIEKPEPTWTTKNKVRMDLHTLKLRDFSQGGKGMHSIRLNYGEGAALRKGGGLNSLPLLSLVIKKSCYQK